MRVELGVCGLQEAVDRALADLAAVFDPLLDGVAEVEPVEDARECVLLGRLGEAGVSAHDGRRVGARASGQRQAAGLKADVVGPKNRLRTAAAAAPSTLCAESWSGIGGVVTSGVQVGSAVVFGFPSVSAVRIAVTGRQ
jgi:hypothetical protein